MTFGTRAYSHVVLFLAIVFRAGRYRFVCRGRVLAGNIGPLWHGDELREVVGP